MNADQPLKGFYSDTSKTVTFQEAPVIINQYILIYVMFIFAKKYEEKTPADKWRQTGGRIEVSYLNKKLIQMSQQQN